MVRLSRPDIGRDGSRELQVGLELPVLHVGVHLDHPHPVILPLSFQRGGQPLAYPVDIMLVDLRHHLVIVQHVDLPDLAAGTHHLTDLRVQVAQLPVDRGTHVKPGITFPRQSQITPGILHFLLEHNDLRVAANGIFRLFLRHQFPVVNGVLVIFLGHQILLLGDQPLLEKLLILQVFSFLLQRQPFLLQVQLLPFQIQQAILHGILFLGKPILAIQYLRFQMLTFQPDNNLARLHHFSLFHENLLHVSPFLHG